MNFRLNEKQTLELAKQIVEQVNNLEKNKGAYARYFSPIYESICYNDSESPEISLCANIYNYENNKIKEAFMRASISILVTDFAISVWVPGEIYQDDMCFFKIYYKFMSSQFKNYMSELRKYLIQKKFNTMKEEFKKYKGKERVILDRYKKFENLLSEISREQQELKKY